MLTIIPKIKNENEIVFEARENDSLIGAINTEIINEILIVTDFTYPDNDAYVLDGLCRSVFSLAVNKGVKIARFSAINDDLKKLGYNTEMDIKSFFDKNCKNSL